MAIQSFQVKFYKKFMIRFINYDPLFIYLGFDAKFGKQKHLHWRKLVGWFYNSFCSDFHFAFDFFALCEDEWIYFGGNQRLSQLPFHVQLTLCGDQYNVLGCLHHSIPEASKNEKNHIHRILYFHELHWIKKFFHGLIK